MIHIISVAYRRPINIRILMDCFRLQTNHDWMLHIIHDGFCQEVLDQYEAIKDCRITMRFTLEVNGKYGHPNRRDAINTIQCYPTDFILLTNDDNYYVPTFIQHLYNAIKPDTGIIIYDTVHSHLDYDIHKPTWNDKRKHGEYHIDIGAFVVRSDIAKSTGFNHDHYSADGAYAYDCDQTRKQKHLSVEYINKPLFIHN